MRVRNYLLRPVATVLVAGGLIGCVNYGPSSVEDGAKRFTTGVVEILMAPADFVATGAKGIQEKGLLGVLELPNAALNGGLRVPEGIGHMFTGNKPRELGEYNPLAEPRAVTGAGWGAGLGAIANGLTPGAGAVIGAGLGLLYNMTITTEKKQ